MTSNIELVRQSKAIGLNLKLSDIMYQSELLWLPLKPRMHLVLNIDAVGSGGSHWVAFAIHDEQALYIDSFGGFPCITVIQYCLKHKLQLGYSNYVCQSLNKEDQMCGQYSILALNSVKRSSDMYEDGNIYVNEFAPDRIANMKILKQLLCEAQTKHKVSDRHKGRTVQLCLSMQLLTNIS